MLVMKGAILLLAPPGEKGQAAAAAEARVCKKQHKILSDTIKCKTDKRTLVRAD